MRTFIEQVLHALIIAATVWAGFFIHGKLIAMAWVHDPISTSIAASACIYIMLLAAVTFPMNGLFDLAAKSKTAETRIALMSLVVAIVSAGASLGSLYISIKS